MNMKHFKQWINACRNGGFRKGRGKLARLRKKGEEHYEYEFCVYGVGMKVAGIPLHPEGRIPVNVGGSLAVAFGTDSDTPNYTGATRSFLVWLGVENDEALLLDWPTEWKDKQGYPYGRQVTHLMNLNDNTDLTLPQMADLMEYLGVVAMREPADR